MLTMRLVMFWPPLSLVEFGKPRDMTGWCERNLNSPSYSVWFVVYSLLYHLLACQSCCFRCPFVEAVRVNELVCGVRTPFLHRPNTGSRGHPFFPQQC